MLEIKNVTKYYGELLAVDNLSFSVNNGSIFGLLGSTGAGKTTTFKMIMGLLSPSDGTILLDGKAVDYETTKDIGYLIEERSLLSKMKVYDQLFYIAKLKVMDNELIDQRIDYYLDLFGISDYKTKKIKELSKGNQQKIQFIASVINEPKLLILDEPFSGLDPFNVDLFVSVIKSLQERGSIIIFSSHQMNHVEKFCEELLFLVKGKAVMQGNINELKEGFGKKTINIKADLDLEQLKAIDGVEKVVENAGTYQVLVSSKDVVSKVFEYVKTCENVYVFEMVLPSLHEIFVEKVGANYEG